MWKADGTRQIVLGSGTDSRKDWESWQCRSRAATPTAPEAAPSTRAFSSRGNPSPQRSWRRSRLPSTPPWATPRPLADTRSAAPWPVWQGRRQLAGASAGSPGVFHRVTHANGELGPDTEYAALISADGVPNLPFGIMGYVHSRAEYWESSDAADVQSTFVCAAEEQKPLDCNLSVSLFGINAAHSSYAGFKCPARSCISYCKSHISLVTVYHCHLQSISMKVHWHQQLK